MNDYGGLENIFSMHHNSVVYDWRKKFGGLNSGIGFFQGVNGARNGKGGEGGVKIEKINK